MNLSLHWSLRFLFFPHWWEKHVSNSRNSCLEAKLNSIVNCLWANNSSFFSEQFKPTQTPCAFIIVNTFQILIVNYNVARNVISISAFKFFNLGNNHVSVLINWFFLYLFNDFSITLSASNENLSLHQFYKALNSN